MRSWLLSLTLGGFASIATLQASPILLETTTTPTAGQPNAVSLASWQFLGSTFVLTSPSHIDGIGTYADVTDGGTIFGAILSLSNSNPNALPSGSPFDSSTVASVLLSPGSTQSVVFAPLSVDLSAGTYAVVFGTGYFGATSALGAYGVSNGTPNAVPAGGSQIGWGFFCGADCWKTFRQPSQYFFEVTGTGIAGSGVPEPSAMFLVCAGLVSIIVLRRARQKSFFSYRGPTNR